MMFGLAAFGVFSNGMLWAQATSCKTIKGQMSETIVPASQAPNDPFGRILGLFNGDFGGVNTAAVTAFLTRLTERFEQRHALTVRWSRC